MGSGGTFLRRAPAGRRPAADRSDVDREAPRWRPASRSRGATASGSTGPTRLATNGEVVGRGPGRVPSTRNLWRGARCRRGGSDSRCAPRRGVRAEVSRRSCRRAASPAALTRRDRAMRPPSVDAALRAVGAWRDARGRRSSMVERARAERAGERRHDEIRRRSWGPPVLERLHELDAERGARRRDRPRAGHQRDRRHVHTNLGRAPWPRAAIERRARRGRELPRCSSSTARPAGAAPASARPRSTSSR